MDGRIDRWIKSDFIGCCLTNIEHPQEKKYHRNKSIDKESVDGKKHILTLFMLLS